MGAARRILKAEGFYFVAHFAECSSSSGSGQTGTYYYYFDIKNNCAQVLRNAAVRSDEELRREWLEVIRGHGIEKDARDIGIQRIGGRVKMWLNYQEPLDVSLLGRSFTLYSFDFTPSADVGGEE